MDASWNDFYTKMLITSNLIAILQLTAAIRWPRLSRLSFFFLFAWACWINWTEARNNPQEYLNYAHFAWISWYREFIRGWFMNHIPVTVSVIAVCQGLIAISMLLKGRIFQLGAVGSIIFLLAILPLGLGAGFPCTAIMAAAMFLLIKSHKDEFIWQHKS